jgi:hypothetical protein
MNNRPNQYVLGARPRITLATVDQDGATVMPTEARLSILRPDQVVVTVSGAQMTNMTTYLAYDYTPTTSGFYQYESWCKDTNGREAAAQHAFMVTNRVG